MQYRDAQDTRLQRAKALASRLLQNLAAQDSALVLPVLLPETASSSPLFLSRTPDTWQEQLAAIQREDGQEVEGKNHQADLID